MKINFIEQNIKTDNTKETLGPKLVQLNSDNLTVYKIYDSVGELLKVNSQIRRPTLSKAINENTIYKDYRWFYLPRDIKNINQYITENIKSTHKLHNQKTYDYTAQIDKTKTKILNVFLTKNIAAEYLNKPGSSLDRPLLNYTLYNGYYFRPYNLCSNELVKEYEDKNGKPILYLNGVGKFDSNNNLIEEFEYKTYCFKSLGISDRTFTKFFNKDIKYNDYYYKTLPQKLKHL